MQVLSPLIIWNLNKVAATIPFRVILVNSAYCMKRLMDVTNIMNKEPQSIWESLFVREMRKLFHHFDIYKILLIVFRLIQLVNQCRYDFLNRLFVKLEPRVILNVTPSIQVRIVHKMPSRLKSPPFSFDLISKRGAFHKRVLPLMTCHPFIWFWIHL